MIYASPPEVPGCLSTYPCVHLSLHDSQLFFSIAGSTVLLLSESVSSKGSQKEFKPHNDGKGGWSLRGAAVTTETAKTAKTVKAVGVASLSYIL